MSFEIITEAFPDLSEKQKEQFETLFSLYQFWNAQINVISRKDLDELYERHILHSLAIAKFIQFLPGSNILDVGTGGGFPGIPLAIMFPETEFLLVDSIGKKIKVVEEVAKACGLKNVRAKQERAEKIDENAYPHLVNSLFNVILRICKLLPCPECAKDASNFLSKINVKEYKTKIEFWKELHIQKKRKTILLNPVYSNQSVIVKQMLKL